MYMCACAGDAHMHTCMYNYASTYMHTSHAHAHVHAHVHAYTPVYMCQEHFFIL